MLDLVNDVDKLIGLLGERGYGSRDRLFRKLAEETGEYAEAIEYLNGSTRKVAKFAGKETPEEKLKEEVSDMVMMGLALARVEGMHVKDVLLEIYRKLSLREDEYQKSLKE
jgi:NTP pyrophosphatase (non-canonical NTP hydrolase)